ncbi:MAG TPA: nucleotide sugar dehydrogenase [Pyrinomonadaceae bacterium]
MIKDDIIKLITDKGARVGVIGLGYVGLPLLVEFARNGFDSTGFEVDSAKAADINAGRSYIGDVPSSGIKELTEAQIMRATTDFNHLKSCDAIIICVPTPLRKTKEPDVSYILAAAEEIQKNLRRGQLIVLESTTYPGTTDEVLLPMFEETGLKLDADFLLAFSPERVDPGNPQFQTHNIPKVVGGCTDSSTEAAAHLYSQIVRDVHAVTSARVAEAAKLLENTFRAVNIGMANEMARLCYALGIDTWEVIRAAATKPFGFMPFYPGPGIGGHCLAGHEMGVVRSPDGLEQVKSLEAIFSEQSSSASARRFEAGGGEVIYRPLLKALSLDMETQEPQWKSVRYLFRRKTDGPIVTVTTSDNRSLTVTDQHPMLVCDEEGMVRQVFARDLKEGDRLPIHCLPAPSVSKAFKQAGPLTTTPVKSIEIKTNDQPVEVYSMEVDDTHTFATSYGIYVHNCIPLDPHYLSWKARQHGFDSRFIGLAEEVNSRMPEHVVTLVADGLNDDRKALKGSRVLLLGVAYKKDVNDVRESPALSIIDRLRAKGADVSYHDPFVPEVRFDDAHTEGNGAPLSSVTLTDEELRLADCVVIVTDHSQINYRHVTELAPLIIDTRNALGGELRRESRARIIRL